MKLMKSMINYGLICMVCLFNNFKTFGQNNTDKHIFRAGISSTDITPPLGLGIVGNYGDPPLANHIHDPLSVKTLVLDDGLTRIAIVIVDNLGVPSWICEAAKDTVFKETKMLASNIMIASTHTHSAVNPAGDGDFRWAYGYGTKFDEYQKFMIRRIADGVRIAINNLRPARIGWGSFERPQHVFNRRWYMKELAVNPFGFLDSVKTNAGLSSKMEDLSRPAGPTDPEVSFIAVKTLSGQPMAILANYSLHYVGGVPKHDISADYFGEFNNSLKRKFAIDPSAPFLGIMSNGTSGDINNMNFAKEPERYPIYEKMKVVANDLAKGVADQFEKLTYHDWVPLKAVSTVMMLKIRNPSAELIENQEKIKQHQDPKPLYHRLEKFYVERVDKFVKRSPEKIPVTIQAFSIGDLAISGIPFEVFAEAGLELKVKSPFKKSFTVGLANGYWGYLPTRKQHRLGGYETWITANKVEINASEQINDKVLSLFEKLKKDK